MILALLYNFVLKDRIFGNNEESTPEPSVISTDTALSYVDSGMTLKVSDITGLKYTDAVSKYSSIYNLTVSEKKYSTNYAAGEIMEQSVDAGTEFPADQKRTFRWSSASVPPPPPFPTFRANPMKKRRCSLFPSDFLPPT